MKRYAIRVKVGWSNLVIPLDLLSRLEEFVIVEGKHGQFDGEWEHRWHRKAQDKSERLSPELIDLDQVTDEPSLTDAEKTAAQPVVAADVVVAEPPKQDTRLMAAGGDRPITVAEVPPLREFVDEFRGDEVSE